MSKILTKRELVDAVSEHAHHYTKHDIETLLEAAAIAIRNQMAIGNDVKLPGLGTLKLAHRKATTARNPRTGEAIEVPAKRTVKFRPSNEMLKAVE